MDMITLAAARKYVKDSLEGKGAIQGEAGKSAYEVAVENGYEGTVTQWLQSLRGQSGSSTTLTETLLWQGACAKGGTMVIDTDIHNYQFIVAVVGKCRNIGCIFADDTNIMAFSNRVNSSTIGSCASRLSFSDDGKTITNVETYYMTHFASGSNSAAFDSEITALYGYWMATPILLNQGVLS